MLWRKTLKGKGELYAAVNDDNFAGFAYVVANTKMAYLFFLAVTKDQRGKGIGGKILTEIKQRYGDKSVTLNIEEIDETSKNYNERLRRKAFYEKNGFRIADIKTKECGVKYDMLVYGKNVTYKDYADLMKNFVGKVTYKLLFGQTN
ncbi:MAG: GNAT family N-acetyltransferase [Clostridia bacterium]|nr:GNAT family N-acetyltransferase [Clostridia bacterium]